MPSRSRVGTFLPCSGANQSKKASGSAAASLIGPRGQRQLDERRRRRPLPHFPQKSFCCHMLSEAAGNSLIICSSGVASFTRLNGRWVILDVQVAARRATEKKSSQYNRAAVHVPVHVTHTSRYPRARFPPRKATSSTADAKSPKKQYGLTYVHSRLNSCRQPGTHLTSPHPPTKHPGSDA